MRSPLFVLVLVLFAAASACSSQPAPVAPASATNIPSAAPLTCDESKDQAAIAAMAGSYHVSFDFDETDVLTPGYVKHPPLHTGATELVIVLDNSPGHVSLQHVLDAFGVTKHWRQDWTFEDRELLEFKGHNTWQKRSISAQAAHCTWTQAVFEVDDSPRYEGIGFWRHTVEGSVWESNQTFRPLPRREYTKRSDYDVLLGVNRHRITPNGWQHEQDNVKLVLEPRHELVRERGRNTYTRVDPKDTQDAAQYWQKTGAFWAQVRDEWARELGGRSTLQLHTEVAGKRLYEPLFERAETTPDPGATTAFIHETISPYLLGGAEPSAKAP